MIVIDFPHGNSSLCLKHPLASPYHLSYAGDKLKIFLVGILKLWYGNRV
jgi:hypothetical protein